MIKRTGIFTFASLAVPSALALAWGCHPKKPPPEAQDAGLAVVASVPEIVPPAAPTNATPPAEPVNIGNVDSSTPYGQAKIYEAQGQLWMGRLVLEQKALGPDATDDETELLAKICVQQNDSGCVDACSKKLGRKIKMDPAPSGSAAASASSNVGAEHREPNTDVARARDLVLKNQLDPARKMLEPKVLDGRASREEIRLLKVVCQKQGDRMCMALCDAKLK